MLSHFLLISLLVVPLPLLAQVEATQGETTAAQPAVEDTQMQTPPPVNAAPYATTPLSEDRSNYLSGGLTFSTAYSDNVLGSITSHPVSDISYSVWPFIALDETTARMHWLLNYSPGFTFYQRTSAFNQADQNVNIAFRYRLSPHVTLDLQDRFQKTSNVLNNPNLDAGTPISGTPQAPVVNVISPLADQLNNVGTAQLTYQFGAMSMVGGGGTFTNLHYDNPTQVPGLGDSNSQSGSAFYTHRFSKKHYIGASYQYARFLTYPVSGVVQTQTHGITAFYTLFVSSKLSLSFSGGPQHTDESQGALPLVNSWSPVATASVGWQGHHTALAGSYVRVVSAGGGLLGAFHSNTANASVTQQLTKYWNAAVSASYSTTKTLTPLFFGSNQDGHFILGSASVGRSVGPHIRLSAGYTRLHQSYAGIAAVATTPDTNRESVSISYNFSRPLGR